jgi:hypothetical protein
MLNYNYDCAIISTKVHNSCYQSYISSNNKIGYFNKKINVYPKLKYIKQTDPNKIINKSKNDIIFERQDTIIIQTDEDIFDNCEDDIFFECSNDPFTKVRIISDYDPLEHLKEQQQQVNDFKNVQLSRWIESMDKQVNNIKIPLSYSKLFLLLEIIIFSDKHMKNREEFKIKKMFIINLIKKIKNNQWLGIIDDVFISKLWNETNMKHMFSITGDISQIRQRQINILKKLNNSSKLFLA